MTNVNTLGDNESYQATTSKRVFEEERSFAPEESNEYYFVVWIDEIGDEQPDTGTFRATINFDSADGKGLTSTVVPEPNAPNIDNGNLIPVYYDNSDEVWRKADSTNANNSWYNYDNKEWANAVLISDATTRETYQAIGVNEEVPESVIDAFYVWIPRYKYRVWNISRQQANEIDYAYPAFSHGIDIEWEQGTVSTGNVVCNYDMTISDDDINLSDVCIYDGKTTIDATSVSSSYTNAWYTHPAFDFGGVPKTGIWIGKFETSGEATAPTILPDQIALSSQVVSAQFTTSRIFQTYGLSNNMDAHMVTNLEWGAVAYLTQSIYGLCNGTSCRDVYINNSSDFYTGRSGGDVASRVLSLQDFYGSALTTVTNTYNSSGFYNYKGYMFDYNGNIATKDVSKVASTTGNVTGIYDMVGGSYEYVMGNMYDETGVFYTRVAGTDWNGSSTLDSKYYNSYPWIDGTSTTDDQRVFNRARLGDATSEVIGVASFNTYSAWRPGVAITGGRSSFLEWETPWPIRSGKYDRNTDSGIFYFAYDNGGYHKNYSFRSSIS